MEARRCHKCGSAMLPCQTLYFNFVFTQVEFACTKCHKKIAVSGKMMIGASLMTGLIGLGTGNPLYMTGGLFIMLSPFYRRMRNPVMDEQTLALGLGIIPTSPLDEKAVLPVRVPKEPVVERPSRAFESAEAAIDRAIADRQQRTSGLKKPPVGQRFVGSREAAGAAGFGRRRTTGG